MTNEVAKKIIRGITDKIECNTVDIDDWAEFWGFTREEYEEFFDMAIKALEQQPCEDCISRQKALDCFEQTNTRQGAKYAIETLPSVTPERPKGKWIFHKSFDDGHKNCNECIECNQCHTWLGYDCYAKTRYCPICGSYNGGDEDADSD